MITYRLVLPLLTACAFFLAYCAQNSDSKSGGKNDPAQPENVQEAMNKAQKSLETLQGEHANINPVPFRKLKELLPERLLDLPRTGHTGESTGAMGMKFSTAEANYREGNKRLKVRIVDAGGLGAATLSMAAWSTMEIDKEDEQGYERSTKWGEFKALESCRTANNHCSFKLYSEKGIIAEIDGFEIPVSDLKRVPDLIKLATVASLRE